MPDWLLDVLKIGGGFLTGGLTGWFSRPMATVKAQERTDKGRRRRKLIDDARVMISERQVGTVNLGSPIGRDPRFLAIKPHLSEAVATKYAGAVHQVNVTGLRSDLIADVDRLEKRWKLL